MKLIAIKDKPYFIEVFDKCAFVIRVHGLTADLARNCVVCASHLRGRRAGVGYCLGAKYPKRRREMRRRGEGPQDA